LETLRFPIEEASIFLESDEHVHPRK